MPHRRNTFAALDLGSNSFHLVIARKEKDRLFFMDREKVIVRLAEGLDAHHCLSPKAQQRAFDALSYLEERIRGFPEEAVRVVGTNTLRAAKNSADFLKEAEKRIGFPIAVINGREEARLVFKGVTYSLPPSDKSRFVIDIGGGSTELIWGKQEPKVLESLHMGCVSFSKRYFGKGTLTQKQYREALLGARLEVSAVREHYRKLKTGFALGSSGTIKSIEAVMEKMGLLENGITLKGMDQLAQIMVEARSIDRLRLPGLKEDRLPVFPGGVAILHAILMEIPLPPLHASQYALREGVLYELVGRVEKQDLRELTVLEMMDRYLVDQVQVKRVHRLSLKLFEQLKGKIPYLKKRSRRYLHWAACLHEIGLSISHSGYHKHGWYIVTQSDMPGFNRTEKRILGFLIGNHRRRIRLDKQDPYFSPPWALLLVFRLACLFLRNRSDTHVTPLQLSYKTSTITLSIKKTWLEENQLTAKQLEEEIKIWKAKGKKFQINPI